ncbi:ribonuclease P protein subunit p25-like protein isoform X2 [Protopterus annectens]|uniref:ribonuclease P protein subunit p25-like protein isoform X2 n=1 Tax=Protopterus annectens TaxID=7888 RepID=UPI001CFABE8D|nr:ribonuclease P protein subunit p25-like protein isoform X2 [Protopterus annectens]
MLSKDETESIHSRERQVRICTLFVCTERMENYKKSKVVEHPCPLPFSNLPSDIIEIKVKEGSKIWNLMGYAVGKMEPDAVKQTIFSGSGKGVSKTITCVEIMKRRIKGLHQITKLLFKQVEEIWESIVPVAGLDTLTVKRNVPAVCVLLSKDAFDMNESGYRTPGCFDTLWIQALKEESQFQKRRRQSVRGGPSRRTGYYESSKSEVTKKLKNGAKLSGADVSKQRKSAGTDASKLPMIEHLDQK